MPNATLPPPLLRHPGAPVETEPERVDLGAISEPWQSDPEETPTQWSYTITFACGCTHPGCGNGPNRALAYRERDTKDARGLCYTCRPVYACEAHRFPVRRPDPNCPACNLEAAWREVEAELETLEVVDPHCPDCGTSVAPEQFQCSACEEVEHV